MILIVFNEYQTLAVFSPNVVSITAKL